MPAQKLNWLVAGAAGEGAKTTGLLFSKTCLRHGLFTFDYTEYPSLIRGGHNTYQVTASDQKVFSPNHQLDVLVALDELTLKLHQDDLTAHTITIYDAVDAHVDPQSVTLPGTVYNVPLVELARNAGGERVMMNNVALGASLFLLGLKLEHLNAVIASVFGDKGQAVVSSNQKSAQAGYDYATKNMKPLPAKSFASPSTPDNISFTGNEAVSLGMIAGGLQAYIAYPMTPASSILHTLAAWQAKAKILVKHAEDEIGVINMSLGSSFAGVRTAVGTSGGGFCYMTEALGLAGVAELPIVIINAMRPGPALGMPTWTAQGDLLFAINASQDEFPRIVLSPGDVAEAFELGRQSLELAEKFQLPVIILLDKHLSESGQSMCFNQTQFTNQRFGFAAKPSVDDTGFYPRYQVGNGISDRSIPGQKDGYYIANSYEHDDHGIANEDTPVRIAQMDKRFHKVTSLIKDIPQQFYEGPDHAQVTLIGWGSTKNALRAAANLLKATGVNVAVFNLSWLWPFPTAQVVDVLKRSQTPIIFEGNKTQQLAHLIRQETGQDIYHKRTRYDGRPFYPEDIAAEVQKIIK